MPKKSRQGEIGLITWYVNTHRVGEVLGEAAATIPRGGIIDTKSMLGPLVLKWMQRNQVPSFSKLVSSGKLDSGEFFFHDARYFSSGFDSAAFETPKDVKLWFPMSDLSPERSDRLEILFNLRGLTTDSAFGALQRSPHMFVCGVILNVSTKTIEAVPLVIGNLIKSYAGDYFPYAPEFEIRASDFDVFADIDFSRRVSLKELGILKTIPEAKVKEVFGEMMLQPFLDKDWGGETGDLFSGSAKVNGKRTNCGFMFKGPSWFHKLHPGDCGKRGDQIIRLYDYPAKCFVLQHCHDVAPSVRRQMRALTFEKLDQGARFCIIDGRDTYFILKHFRVI